jgi:hypothetical protein
MPDVSGVGELAAFAYGVGGGMAAELLGLFRLRRKAPGQLPLWLKSPFYWLVTIAMMLAGGGLALAYVASHISLSPILAVNVGASAPLILGTLTSQTPDITPGKID